MASLTHHPRLLGVSTKMYLSLSETSAYIAALLDSSDPRHHVPSQTQIFVLVDHVSLVPSLLQTLGSHVLVGAQDCATDDSGSFTGHVSPSVLAEAGCALVMVGHAERRRLCGETDEVVARKAAAVARNGMVPLVCVGELEEGGAEDAVRFCGAQVESVMGAVEGEVVLAYEPVWAIGRDRPAGKEHVEAVVAGLRGLGCVKGRGMRVVYGGSAGPGVWEGLKGSVDGLFMARFGLELDGFWGALKEVDA